MRMDGRRGGGWQTLMSRIVLINKVIPLLLPSRELVFYRHWSSSVSQLHAKQWWFPTYGNHSHETCELGHGACHWNFSKDLEEP